MSRIQMNFHLHAEDTDRAALFYQENFNFQLAGKMNDSWAVLQCENAMIWLGPNGSKNGLILLIEDRLEEVAEQLKQIGVTVSIPEEFQGQQGEQDHILETVWGKHVWIVDTEGNLVMLFQPIDSVEPNEAE